MSKTTINKTPIGGHVSASGGLHTCFERAKEIGAEAIQIFGATPRGWAFKLPTQEQIEKFKKAHTTSGGIPVWLHAAYLPNLASPEAETREKSVANLAGHLKIAEMIGAEGLIFHLGSGKEASKESAIRESIKGMKEILSLVPGRTILAMENSAGGGKKLGSTAEDLGELFCGVDSSRLKICVDTAHALEGGLIKNYDRASISELIRELDKSFGWENVAVIHANDSMTPADSHYDRHENIGDGYIGLQGFIALAAEHRMHGRPWLLEVPGVHGGGPDSENIRRLKACF